MFKIALTNLGKYNEGVLDFVWLDLPYTEEELADAMKEIGIDGIRYEEYFITDYESDYGIEIGEYENLEKLNGLAERLEALSDYDKEVLAAFLEGVDSDLSYALDRIESGDCQLYSGMDLEEVAEQFVEEGLFSTETLLNYIDFERLGRDLSYDGYTETEEGVLYCG